MNWGKGIITGMALFMLFILSMCVYMFRAPADEYDHQYYEKGLTFNSDYNRQRQVVTDNARPLITQSGQTLKLAFTAPVAGTIRFIRPSSQAMDQSFSLDSGKGNSVAIPLAAIKTGRWQLVLAWQQQQKTYLYRQEIYIQ